MQFYRYLLYPSQFYMFRMLRPSILRSTVMYRREGTVYVRTWCVVRGRVPTRFIYKDWYMMHGTMKIKLMWLIFSHFMFRWYHSQLNCRHFSSSLYPVLISARKRYKLHTVRLKFSNFTCYVWFSMYPSLTTI